MEFYNSVDIIPISPPHDFKQWDRCFTSTMKRALETARLLNWDDCVKTDLLREVPLRAGFQTRIKLPVFLWAMIARFQWLIKTGPQPENRRKSLNRARKFIHSHCLSASHTARILVITHGFFMTCLRWELLKLGFSGPLLTHVKNGKLYIFKKDDKSGNV
jgi:broad specificity phosphatase PhoE